MTNDRTIVIPMSSSGHCPRALSAELLGRSGKDKPSWLATAAEEGNLHEDAIKSKLRAEGYHFNDDRNECVVCKERFGNGRKGIHLEIEQEKFVLLGHTDGIIIDKEFEPKWQAILECKSMSQYEFDRWMKGKWNEFPQYADQLTCYMKAANLTEALYVVKNRNSGYTKKTRLIESPSNFDEIINRLNTVVDCVLADKLCEAEYDSQAIQCKRCSYISLCLPDPRKLDPVAIRQLEEALDTRAKAKDSIKELDAIVTTQEFIIKSYMINNDQLKMKFNGYTLSMNLGQTRTTYSEKNLLEAGIDKQTLERAKTVSKPFDALYIRRLDKEND